MKKLTLSLTAALILALSSPISPAHAASNALISVNGLVCDFCARALEKTFSKKDEVTDINVNLESKIVTVNFEDGQNLSDETLTELITDAGYNVEAIERGESVSEASNE